MSTKREVEKFLADFKNKLNVFDVIFKDERGKNAQTLLHLEITPRERKEVIRRLEPEDYSHGPIINYNESDADLWIFGKTIKKHETYIKITMGKTNQPVICISFHISEYPMIYPLR